MTIVSVFPDVRLDLVAGMVPVDGPDASDPAWDERRWLGGDGTFLTVARQRAEDRTDPNLALAFGAVLARYENERSGQTLAVIDPPVHGAVEARGARLEIVSSTGEPLNLLAVMAESNAGSRVFVQVLWSSVAEAEAEKVAVALAESLALLEPSGT